MFVEMTFVVFPDSFTSIMFVKSPESEKEFHDKIKIIEKEVG